MHKPLIVGCLSDRAARDAIRGIDCRWVSVTSKRRLPTTRLPATPRLFVIQVSGEEVDESREVLRELREKWPLTDVVLWAPRVGGAVVRSLFQAGAKDVVVSGSAGRLVESVEQTLAGQKILPRLSEFGGRGGEPRFESMLSRSEAMWELFELCTRVAPADATVLIVGETGTGKELLARAVHRGSGRQGRFVPANCASIPAELINSELFGHEKGAFTGADRSKKGLVMHADKGTLFLDEIGDMPPEAQQSLLRMLQERRIRPVGSQVETKVDVRIVAATNVLLDQAVRQGEFREDLFYRLDVIRVNVPALRRRPEDILFLFGHFTKRLAKHYGLNPPIFSDDFLDALLRYDWPGNVRQLENFSERLVLARPQRALTARDFAELHGGGEPAAAAAPSAAENPTATRPAIDAARSLRENVEPTVQRLEEEYLRAVLETDQGRVAEAARRAGISRRTLLRKMNQYGIDKHEFRS